MLRQPATKHDKLLLELQIAWNSYMYNAIQFLAFIDTELMRPLNEHQEFLRTPHFAILFPHMVFFIAASGYSAMGLSTFTLCLFFGQD